MFKRKTALEWLNEGELKLNGKQYKEAIICFNKTLALNPKDSSAWHLKGVALSWLKAYDEAIACFDQNLNINPMHVPTWYNKAVALNSLSLIEDAFTCFDKVLAINPKHILTWHSKGSILNDLRRYDDAVICFDEVLALDPQNVSAMHLKGVALHELHRYHDAITCYDQAVLINPMSVVPWHCKGLALAELQRYHEAIACFDLALAADPYHRATQRKKSEILNYLIKSEQDAIIIRDRSNSAPQPPSKPISPQLAAEPHQQPPSIFHSRKAPQKTGRIQLQIDTINQAIQSQYGLSGNFLHLLDGIQANNLMAEKAEGTFLIRPSSQSDKFAITYCYQGKVANTYLIPHNNGWQIFDSPPFANLASLLEYYRSYFLHPHPESAPNPALIQARQPDFQYQSAPAAPKPLPQTPQTHYAQTPVGNVSTRIKAEDFTKQAQLGAGSYGHVYRGLWHGFDVAIKELHSAHLPEEYRNDFLKEAALMVKLNSPGILRCYGVCLQPLSIIMEYMENGSLYTLLHNQQTLAWALRIRISAQTAHGLVFLHNQSTPILHRDLKSHNILLDGSFNAKLADFGLAELKQHTTISHTHHDQNSKGTLAWKAPELLDRKPIYSSASDIYALGITYWEIASRKLPFHDASDTNLIISWVKNKERPELERLDVETPSDFTSLMQDCWQHEAQHRPSARDIATSLTNLQARIGQPGPTLFGHSSTVSTTTMAPLRRNNQHERTQAFHSTGPVYMSESAFVTGPAYRPE